MKNNKKDLMDVLMVNETFQRLIVMPEDAFTEKKETEISVIIKALRESSDDIVYMIIEDLIKRERNRRMKFMSKKKRTDLEYINKKKMIELRLFLIKSTFFIVAILLLMTYSANLHYSFATGKEPMELYGILNNVLNLFLPNGD